MRLGFIAMMLWVPLLLSGQQKQSVPDAPAPQTTNSLSDLTSKVAPGMGTGPADQTDSTGEIKPGVVTEPPRPETAPDQVQKTPPEIAGPGEMRKDIAILVTNVNFVTVPATVLDKHHQEVAGLTWRDFQIYQDGVEQRIAFFSADPVPLSVALVIDQSLPKDTMRKVNDSLSALPGAFTPQDEVAVYTYSDGVNNPTSFTAATGTRLTAVLEASQRPGDEMEVPVNSGPFAEGPTVNGRSVDPNLEPQRDAGNGYFLVLPRDVRTLNDAILAAGQALSTRPHDRRRIIYVIGDGKEARSKASYREVVRYLQTNQIAVYGTLVGDSATWGLGYLDKIRLPLLPLSPDNILPRYASDTGGQLEAEFTEDGIQRSFAQLAVLARTQYTLGFYSHISLLNGNFRKLDVRVLRPNLDVIAKQGYYPTATNMNR